MNTHVMLRRVALKFDCNPVGNIHNIAFNRNATNDLKCALARDLRYLDNSASGIWHEKFNCYLLLERHAKSLGMIAPFTHSVSKVFGDGRVDGKVAKGGFESDGMLPEVGLGLAHGATWVGYSLGLAVARACGKSTYGAAGAQAGAFIGAAAAWLTNQGLGCIGLAINSAALMLAWGVAVTNLLWDAAGDGAIFKEKWRQRFSHDANSGFVPGKVRRAVASYRESFGRFFNWSR